jgi:tetratricopeptide (TPR) repeat protein
MTARRDIGLLALALLLGALPVAAMDDGGGRSVFATGAGNRSLAMGGAYAAVADDAAAPLYNPAGLALVERKELQASQTTLFGLGFNEQFASFVLPHWRLGTASLTWRRFGVDGIEERDERGFLLDPDLSDSETELTLAYAHLLLDGDLALGGSFKVQRHALAGYSDSGFGLDLGAWARPLAIVGLRGRLARELSLGLALRNAVEPVIKLDEDGVPDPTGLRAGLAWRHDLAEGLGLVLATDLEKTRGMDGRLHAGAECLVHRTLALRVGTADGTLTAGAGLAWRGLGVDYQYEDNHLGDIHRFGLTVRFGATVAESRSSDEARAEAEIQSRLESAFAARAEAQEQQLLAETRRDLDRGQWDDALTRIGTLAVLAPHHPELPALTAAAHAGAARRQENRGDLVGAALSWRRALAALPDDPEAQAGLARVEAESDHRAARTREIKARYEAALDAFTRDDLATARDGFAAVLELRPQDADAAIMLTRTEAAMTRRATVLGEEAVSLGQAGRLEEARARLDAARLLDAEAPGLTLAARELDRLEAEAARARSGSRPAAAVMGAPAAGSELSPERRREIDALYRRGIEAMQAGRRSDAVRYWELVWSADPDHEQVRQYLAREYLARGMEAYAGGSLRRAVESWEEALRVDPDDQRAHGYLERAHQQIARMEKISASR